MSIRDPRSSDPPSSVQGYGRDPTQSISPEAGYDDTRDAAHLSLALGTHGRQGGTKITPPPAPQVSPPPIPRAPTGDPDRIGSILGSYKVVELLGKGGMGCVFRAEHMKLGREVALKLLRGDYARRRDAVARFFQEIGRASCRERV